MTLCSVPVPCMYDDGVRGACVFGEWYVLSTIPYMYKHSYESVVWYNTRILGRYLHKLIGKKTAGSSSTTSRER